MTLETILHIHNINDFELKEKLQSLMRAEFKRGLDEGASAQAIIELQGRERFLEELKEKETRTRCGVCGGRLAEIRGRYPNQDRRQICPTCNTERLEQINEISSAEYGKAYKATP